MKQIVIILFLFFASTNILKAQNSLEFEIATFLRQANDTLINNIIKNPKKYRLQIIFTQINRDLNNDPIFKTYTFSETESYFNPASLVKLPVTCLMLEKLKELNLSPEFRYSIGDQYLCKNNTYIRKSIKDTITFKDDIIRMLVISDDNSYNRCYEFLTPEYIREKLNQKGLKDISIINKFGGCSVENSLNCNSISVFSQNGKLVFEQKSSLLTKEKFFAALQHNPDKLIGKYYQKDGKLVPRPFDFNYSNTMPLMDLHEMMIRLIFPNTQTDKNNWNLNKEDYINIYRWLSAYPSESGFELSEDKKKYPDNFVNYFIYGDYKGEIKKNDLRIFNIVGQSFGFISESAYIVDFSTSTEFFVSAILYTNANEIINDGKYEYSQIAIPFMAKIGRLLLYHEINRKKVILPDLNRFKIDY